MEVSYYIYYTLSNGEKYYTKLFDKERDAYLYITTLCKQNSIKDAMLFERKDRVIHLKELERKYSHE